MADGPVHISGGPPALTAAQVARQICARIGGDGRHLIALAGPPGSGKSTLASALVEAISKSHISAIHLPMDGFHLDNDILAQRDRLTRKGAPDTFDVGGLASLLARIKDGAAVFAPQFDRVRDLAVAGAIEVSANTQLIVVEGNYLLLNHPDWDALQPHWATTVQLEVPLKVLRSRLIQRWIDLGATEDAARTRAEHNDIPNAQTVLEQSRQDVDILIRYSGA